MAKITDLTNYTTPNSTDVLPIVDIANNTSKKITVANLIQPATITPAEWTNPYCFKAYNSTLTTLSDNSPVKILFQTEVYDYGADFASSTYTAPVAGVYSFSAGLVSTAVATVVTANIRLYVNGAVKAYAPSGTNAAGYVANIQAEFLLAADDTVEVYFLQDSAGAESTVVGEDNTWFSGHLVHKV